MEFGLKEKIIAGAGALVLIVAGWYFFYYGPLRSDVAAKNREIEDIRMQIQQSSIDPSMIEDLVTQIDELEKKNLENENIVLPIDSIGYVMDVLENQCALFSLEITQPITPDKEALFFDRVDSLDTGMKLVPIELYLRGTFFDIGKFVESFRELPFLIKAGDIQMETGDEIYPAIESLLNVYVFFRK